MQFDPAQLGRAETYALLSSGIVPRPIAFVSTVAADGTANLAPFDFFAPISSDPPRLILSVGGRRGGLKDTAANILATRDFVINIVSEEIAEQMECLRRRVRARGRRVRTVRPHARAGQVCSVSASRGVAGQTRVQTG